jgi:methylmalonyl-CoA mutase N-terminal domain/subunit
MLRFHTQTAGCTLTAQQPENNIVRVALQALAAVLGGTQSLHTNSFDEALALPSEDAARLALRTQQLIAHESGVTDFVDPLAGSYAVETLTSEIETRALALVERIDQLGGMVAAIEAGFPQREIQRSAYACQRAIESGQRTVVGVNRYQMAGGPMPGLLRVAPEVENEQRRRLAAVRAGRDQVRWRARMEELRRAASTTTENLLPAILGAVKAEATVGEVTDTLAEVFGHYRERVVL